MSDTPTAESPRAPDVPTPSRWPSVQARWLTFAALVIALIAVALAAVAWFRPAHGASSRDSTDGQINGAKVNVCAAYMTVHRAVVTNTHLVSPPEDGPIGGLAVATSARLALYGGGGYLRDRLTMEPAAPADLAKAVNSLATTLEDLGIGYLADAPAFAQDRLRRDLDTQFAQVDQLCK